MTKPGIRGVFDAGPIIHLDELKSTDLLQDFQEIVLSETVWKEIEKHRPAVIERSELSITKVRRRYPVDERLKTLCQIFCLDEGEIEALAILENDSAATFFTDDASARLVAEQFGFKVHGAIGILVRSIRRAQRKPEDVLSIIKTIPSRSTLYIKASLLHEIINTIKKEYQI